MASVRTTAPRSDSGNKKRKRSSTGKMKARAHFAPSAIATTAAVGATAVDIQARCKLEAQARWQLCTQKNLSEIRTECMSVRRALERVEQLADMAVAQAQDEAAEARSARSQAKQHASATVALVENVQRDVENATAALRSEVESVKKRARTLDQRVQQFATQSIDEDFLMTQLTELQERHDMQLSERCTEWRAELQTAQRALTAQLEQFVSASRTDHTALDAQLIAAMTRVHDLERTCDASRNELADASRANAALETQLQAVTHRMFDLERQPVAAGTDAADATPVRLEAALDELTYRCERQLQEMEHRIDRKLNAAASTMNQQLAPAVRQHHHHSHHDGSNGNGISNSSDGPAVHDRLHRLSRDVHRMADDLHRLAQRIDARHDEMRDGFAAQLRDLGTELFAALRYDSRTHMAENKRLRELLDASHRELRDDLDTRVRDLVEQSVRDLRAGMSRLDDNMRHMPTMGCRSRSRSPRRPARPPRSPSPPARSMHARRETNAFYHESAPSSSGGFAGRSEHPAPPSYARPRRSRSRSRSPVARVPRRSNRYAGPPLSSIRRESESAVAAMSSSRSRDASVESDRTRTSAPSVSRDASPQRSDTRSQVVRDVSGGESGSQASDSRASDRERISSGNAPPPQPVPQPQPLRRSKKPRKSHEVIVIEDDDDVSGDDEFAVAPNRAPPDIVTEDADARPRTIVIYEADDGNADDANAARSNASSSSNMTIAAAEQRTSLNELRLGALLYFCYSGAPSLDFEWTRCFVSLRAGDCVDLARVTGFLHRYPALHAFPIYLAQFVVQASVVAVPANDAQRRAFTRGLDSAAPNTVTSAAAVLDHVDPALVRDQFHRVLDTIRRSWAEKLTAKLQTLSDLNPSATDAVRFAVHPQLLALGATAAATAAGTTTQQQQLTLWRLEQAKTLWALLRQHRFGARMPVFSGDLAAASPGVYVFLLLFDPVHVHRLSPQRANFRLTHWGRALALQLWDSLLSSLPYLLYADCAWLERQTDGGARATLPLLGLCQLLTTVLAWNSVGDPTLASSASFHSELVRRLLRCLYVDGVGVLEHASTAAAGVALDPATAIELRGVDAAFVNLLELDGFFEVVHAVVTTQTRAVAATAATAPSAGTPASTPSMNAVSV